MIITSKNAIRSSQVTVLARTLTENATCSVTNATLLVNNTPVASPFSAVAGDSVSISVDASSSYLTSVYASLTVNNVTDEAIVITEKDPTLGYSEACKTAYPFARVNEFTTMDSWYPVKTGSISILGGATFPLSYSASSGTAADVLALDYHNNIVASHDSTTTLKTANVRTPFDWCTVTLPTVGTCFAVSSFLDRKVIIFSRTLDTLLSIPVQGTPSGVIFADSSLFIAVYDLAKVIKVTFTSSTTYTTEEFSVGAGPLYFTADGSSVFVSNSHESSLSKITGSTVSTIPVSENPWGLANDGTYVYVACSSVGKVDRVTVSDNAVISASVPYVPAFIRVVGSSIYVADLESNTVRTLNSSLDVTDTASFASNLFGLHTNGSTVFVTSLYDVFPTRLYTHDDNHYEIRVPHAFEQPLSSPVVSDVLTIQGITRPSPVAVYPSGSINVEDTPVTSLANGTDFTVTVTSPALLATKENRYVVIGDSVYTFTVATNFISVKAQNIQFEHQTGVSLSTDITSNTVTFTELTEDFLAVAENCTLIVNGIDSGTSATVRNNDTLALRVTSSSVYSSSVAAYVTLGAFRGIFVVRTLADPTLFLKDEYRDMLPSQFDFSSTPAYGDSFLVKLTDTTFTEYPVIQKTREASSVNNTKDYIVVLDIEREAIHRFDADTYEQVDTMSFPGVKCIGYSPVSVENNSTIKSYLLVGQENKISVVSPDTWNVVLTINANMGSGIYATSLRGIPDSSAYPTSGNFKFLVGFNYYGYTRLCTVTAASSASFSNDISYYGGEYGANRGTAITAIACVSETEYYAAVNNNINKIAHVKNSIITMITVGECPQALWLNSTYLYVANAYDNTITRVTLSDHETQTFPSFGAAPNSIAELDGKLYVGHADGTVSELTEGTLDLVRTHTSDRIYGISVQGSSLLMVSHYRNQVSKVAPYNPTVTPVVTALTDLDPSQSTSTSFSVTATSSRGFPLNIFYSGSSLTVSVNGVVQTMPTTLTDGTYTVTISAQASAVPETLSQVVIDSGVLTSWNLTTEKSFVVDPFVFTALYERPLREEVTSNSVKITGLSKDVSVPVSFSASNSAPKSPIVGIAELYINDVLYTEGDTIKNGDILYIKGYSASPYGTTQSYSASASGVTGTFSVKSKALSGSMRYTKPKLPNAESPDYVKTQPYGNPLDYGDFQKLSLSLNALDYFGPSKFGLNLNEIDGRTSVKSVLNLNEIEGVKPEFVRTARYGIDKSEPTVSKLNIQVVDPEAVPEKLTVSLKVTDRDYVMHSVPFNKIESVDNLAAPEKLTSAFNAADRALDFVPLPFSRLDLFNNTHSFDKTKASKTGVDNSRDFFNTRRLAETFVGLSATLQYKNVVFAELESKNLIPYKYEKHYGLLNPFTFYRSTSKDFFDNTHTWSIKVNNTKIEYDTNHLWLNPEPKPSRSFTINEFYALLQAEVKTFPMYETVTYDKAHHKREFTGYDSIRILKNFYAFGKNLEFVKWNTIYSVDWNPTWVRRTTLREVSMKGVFQQTSKLIKAFDPNLAVLGAKKPLHDIIISNKEFVVVNHDLHYFPYMPFTKHSPTAKEWVGYTFFDRRKQLRSFTVQFEKGIKDSKLAQRPAFIKTDFHVEDNTNAFTGFQKHYYPSKEDALAAYIAAGFPEEDCVLFEIEPGWWVYGVRTPQNDLCYPPIVFDIAYGWISGG